MFPLNIAIMLYGVYDVPLLFTEVPSNGGNMCSGISESSNPNVTYENISLIDPPD